MRTRGPLVALSVVTSSGSSLAELPRLPPPALPSPDASSPSGERYSEAAGGAPAGSSPPASARPSTADAGDPDFGPSTTRWRAAGPARQSPFLVSLFGWREAAEPIANALGLGVIVSLPLERVAGRTPTSLERVPAALPASASAPLPLNVASPFDTPSARAVAASVRVPTSELRALIRTSWRVGGVPEGDGPLDDLASRSRTSALLPELRLRTVRTTGSELALTSLDEDPTHTMATGRAVMLYEARATWRLDRLAFADDEVAIERIRVERNEQRVRLTIRLVEAIASWQRAHLQALDPAATPSERLDAAVREVAAAVVLDAMTDGGWSRTAVARAARAPDVATGE